MKKLSLLLFVAVLFAGCGKQMSLGYQPDRTLYVGLNTLSVLNPGPNKLDLRSFMQDPSRIDSVTTTSEEVVAALVPDTTLLDVYCGENMPVMGAIKLWVDGNPYALPVRRSDKINYTFTYDPRDTHPQRVQIAGQMNNWVPSLTPDLVLNEDGLYEVTMLLSPGTYLYQMLIDGDQNHDANNPNMVDNGFGKFNSIMQVTGNEDKFPHLITSSFGANTVELSLTGEATSVWAYLENTLLCGDFVKMEEGRVIIALPAEAKSMDNAMLRVWAANEWGISNDILVPLKNGNVVTNVTNLAQGDKHRQIIYFLLVDRFKNGNSENDRPMNSPEVHPKADYQGGDLAGVTQVMDNNYFATLGVNALWLSPLNQNPFEPYGYNEFAKTKFAGYHGYWPISSSKVDCRFGSNEELKLLVDDAHSKGIRIYLDYVANHVHKDHPLYVNHPELATPLYLPDGRMNTELWDEQRLTTWFDTFIPSLDFGNPKVVDMMTDSALFWIKEFGIDGFRHDACKHVNEEYWRELTYRIKREVPEGTFYQIGESYGSPELVSSYVNSGMLDGQFDFNVYDEATSAFNGVSGGTMTRLANVLQSSLKVYGSHNLMGYISGNHDKPRFMALASGDIKVGEDAKRVGWEREVGITDSAAYDKLALFHTFNATIPGVPVYYYGDEIGMTGGNDPDCRRMMRFDNWNNREQNLFDHVAKLNHLRLDNMALLYGDFKLFDVNDAKISYMRQYFDNSVLVFINNGAESCSFDIDVMAENLPETYTALFDGEYQVVDGKLHIELPPFTSEILY